MTNISFTQTNSDKENSNKYLLKSNQKELGYAYILNTGSANNIYVFIHPEYRSNGFGFLLFSNAIQQLRAINKYPHITLDIEKTNIHANNIVAKCGGMILSEDDKKHWLLKL